MAKTQKADLLDELLAFRARIEDEIHNYPDIEKAALLSIDGGLSHLESARRTVHSLER